MKEGARSCWRPGLASAGRNTAAFSLIELMLALGVGSILAAVAAWHTTAGVERYRAQGAVRYVAARLQAAREESVARGVFVAVRFEGTGPALRFTTYADGSRNGVSAQEIADGVDRMLGASGDLSEFAGVEFGVEPGQVGPDGAVLTSGDPIRFGTSRMASFSPSGTSSSGSVYIRSRRGGEYVVRVFGDTAKIQPLRFDRRRSQWVPL